MTKHFSRLEPVVCAIVFVGLIPFVMPLSADARLISGSADYMRQKELDISNRERNYKFLDLSTQYLEQGKYAESESCLRYIFALNNWSVDKVTRDSARFAHSLAVSLSSQCRYKEAENLFLQVRAVDDDLFEGSSACLAQNYYRQGRYFEARQFALDSLDVKPRPFRKAEPPHTGSGNENAVELSLLDDSNPWPQASTGLSQLLFKNGLGPFKLTHVNKTNLLVSIDLAKGNVVEAERLLAGALNKHKEACGVFHPETVVCLINLANLNTAHGNYSKATDLSRTAMKLIDSLEVPNGYVKVICANTLIDLLQRQGKLSEANVLAESNYAFAQAQPFLDPAAKATSMILLGDCRASQGKFVQARTLYKQAEKVDISQSGENTIVTAARLRSEGQVDALLHCYKASAAKLRLALAAQGQELDVLNPEVVETSDHLIASLQKLGERHEIAALKKERNLVKSYSR